MMSTCVIIRTRPGMNRRNALVVALDKAPQDFSKKAAVLHAQAAHNAEIDSHQIVLRVDEQIALMHIGMEETVPHGMAQKGLENIVQPDLC